MTPKVCYRYDLEGTSLRIYIDQHGLAMLEAIEAAKRFNAVVKLYELTGNIEKRLRVLKPHKGAARE